MTTTSELAQVRTYPYEEGNGLPLFIEPATDALRTDPAAVAAWFAEHRPILDRLSTEIGAIVLRGFPLHETKDFGALIDDYPTPEFGYSAGATPREGIEGKVYEATHAPAQHKLKLHQEMAYLPRYPKRLAFYCKTAPETGGETIIGEMRRFYSNVRPAFRQQVKDKGVLYTRNFRSPDWSSGNEVLDAYHRPWTEAFSTTDKAKVEDDCAKMGLDFEWIEGGISTKYKGQGVLDHPDTGEEIWFNQIATQSLTVENVGEERAGMYDKHYASHPRPYDTRLGDGTPIDAGDLSSLYPLLDEVTVGFGWQHGDVMILDNFFTSHGRNAYTGKRDVQVALLG